MNNLINSLTVLRRLSAGGTIGALLKYGEENTKENFNDLLKEIYADGAQDGFAAFVQSRILHDENPFSVACTEQGKASPYVKEAFIKDAAAITDCLKLLKDGNGFTIGKPLKIFSGNMTETAEKLAAFYAVNGYGKFIDGKAYEYIDGDIVPLSCTSDITLDGLKNYEYEKKAFTDNVCDFVNGLPYSHTLLYGDRGTGKSSTVHAVLNAYAEKGLRLIELDSQNLASIKEIRRKVAPLPLKFIIFIDDLALGENDGRNGSLKAAIEGSVGGGRNVMIVATSNRRHVVKESFAERNDAVHPADTIEEQLSLSDRFGLTIMFSSTDKAQYLSIVRQLAEDYALETPTEILETLAERRAIENGGRSPRRAKQLIDYVYACEKSGRKIEI